MLREEVVSVLYVGVATEEVVAVEDNVMRDGLEDDSAETGFS